MIKPHLCYILCPWALPYGLLNLSTLLFLSLCVLEAVILLIYSGAAIFELVKSFTSTLVSVFIMFLVCLYWLLFLLSCNSRVAFCESHGEMFAFQWSSQ